MMRLINRDWRDIAIMLLCFAIWIGVSAGADMVDKSGEPEQTEPMDVVALNIQLAQDQVAYDAEREKERTEQLEADEAEQIEAALVEQEYFRDDVPLSYELQDYLHTACEESGVPYELALAVIRKETDFRNIIGDDGASAGYMQIQERWHETRLDKLGVTDLMDPFGNFRVGCDFLAELLGKYDLTDALTYYNSGETGPSKYAALVIGYQEEYSKG